MQIVQLQSTSDDENDEDSSTPEDSGASQDSFCGCVDGDEDDEDFPFIGFDKMFGTLGVPAPSTNIQVTYYAFN